MNPLKKIGRSIISSSSSKDVADQRSTKDFLNQRITDPKFRMDDPDSSSPVSYFPNSMKKISVPFENAILSF